MIPITQTKSSLKNSKGESIQHGNCWAAAIASILELPLTEVPNFEVWFEWDDGFWWDLTIRFLIKKKHKLRYNNDFRVFHPELAIDWFNETEGKNPDGLPFELWAEITRDSLQDQYYFVSGLSHRGVSHVTIWQNGKMVHDPHISRDGILELTSFQQIVPLSDEEITNSLDYKNNYQRGFPSFSKNYTAE